MLQPVRQLDGEIDTLANLTRMRRAGLAGFPYAVERVQQAIEIFDQELLPKCRIAAGARQIVVCNEIIHCHANRPNAAS